MSSLFLIPEVPKEPCKANFLQVDGIPEPHARATLPRDPADLLMSCPYLHITIPDKGVPVGDHAPSGDANGHNVEAIGDDATRINRMATDVMTVPGIYDLQGRKIAPEGFCLKGSRSVRIMNVSSICL